MTTTTSTCMACGDTRPDDQIMVHTRYWSIPTVPHWDTGSRKRVRTANISYCADRPSCMGAAHTIGNIFVTTGCVVDGNDPRVLRARKRIGGPGAPVPPKRFRSVAAATKERGRGLWHRLRHAVLPHRR